MRHHDIAIAAKDRRERKLPWSDSLARRGLLGRLNSVRRGRMVVREGGRQHRFGAPTADCPLDVTVDTVDPRAWAEIALGGALGAGEAHKRGWWKADDLTGV